MWLIMENFKIIEPTILSMDSMEALILELPNV